MTEDPYQQRPPRTVLEQHIRDRRMTIEEFAEHLEHVAREHGEPGMIGVRHLQRLMNGKRGDGRPLGPLRPATVRLLERATGEHIDVLLASPRLAPNATDESPTELHTMLAAARRVDRTMLDALQLQLQQFRRTDRQYGAADVSADVNSYAKRVELLLHHCITIGTRRRLAAVLAELSTLGGWQALDAGRLNAAWRWYRLARTAAAESDSIGHVAHAMAEQAYVLMDLGRTDDAISMIAAARVKAAGGACSHLQAWLAAAYGEAQAANSDRSNCSRAFDEAADLLTGADNTSGPYVALNSVHLMRWRGHAMATLGDASSVEVLVKTVEQMDPTFSRARATAVTDLAIALMRSGNVREAERQARKAKRLADRVGSTRQQARIARLLGPER